MTLLDKYLPVFQFRECHQLSTDADPAALLNAASLPEAVDDPWIRYFISLRELPERLLGALGISTTLKNRPAFGLNNFIFLGRESDAEIAFGLVGRFWQLDYGLIGIGSAEEFARFESSGVPKLVLSFWVEKTGDRSVKLHTETRVFCNSRESFRRFRPYWWLIRPVSGLIRRRLLKRICDAAKPLNTPDPKCR